MEPQRVGESSKGDGPLSKGTHGQRFNSVWLECGLESVHMFEHLVLLGCGALLKKVGPHTKGRS